MDELGALSVVENNLVASHLSEQFLCSCGQGQRRDTAHADPVGPWLPVERSTGGCRVNAAAAVVRNIFRESDPKASWSRGGAGAILERKDSTEQVPRGRGRIGQRTLNRHGCLMNLSVAVEQRDERISCGSFARCARIRHHVPRFRPAQEIDDLERARAGTCEDIVENRLEPRRGAPLKEL